MMRKSFKLLIIVFLSFFIAMEAAPSIQAVDIGEALKVGDKGIAEGGTNRFSPGAMLTLFLRNAYILAGVIMLFLVASAGFRIVSGGGAPEDLQKNKQTITLALIGFTVILTSYWIVQLISFITFGEADFLLNGPSGTSSLYKVSSTA